MNACRRIDVIPPSECHTPQAKRSSKKSAGALSAFVAKTKGTLKNGGRPSKTPPRQKTPDVFYYPSNSSSYQRSSDTSIKIPASYVTQETRNHQPASGPSHGDRREVPDQGYQIRPPPPGSYQDDDSGPSPKNLLMAVMGVKSAVNHFAKALILDMTKHPGQLRPLKETISQAPAEVDRANHWKFVVQAFICKHLFEGFEAENGFFGVQHFDGVQMSKFNSFADFTKFKDKAATMSGLLAQNSPDISFLGQFCFTKFKAITRNVLTNLPFPLYEQDWYIVESDRHPQSDFYQRFLQVAVSVWLLHRLVHSFEQEWSMLGWETFPQGCEFQRENMESVVPGGFEDEDEQTSSSTNDMTTVVGFLVIPGFQVSKSVVKCEVYLRNIKNGAFDSGKFMDAAEVQSSSFEKPSTDKTPPSYRTNYSGPMTNYSVPMTNHSGPMTNHSGTMTNYSGPMTNYSSSRTLSEEALSNVRSDGQYRESGGSTSGRSRTGQGRSPGVRKNGSNDRGNTASTHFLEAAPAVPSRQPVYRHTRLSQQREEMNRRTH